MRFSAMWRNSRRLSGSDFKHQTEFRGEAVLWSDCCCLSAWRVTHNPHGAGLFEAIEKRDFVYLVGLIFSTEKRLQCEPLDLWSIIECKCGETWGLLSSAFDAFFILTVGAVTWTGLQRLRTRVVLRAWVRHLIGTGALSLWHCCPG